ncbi:MAG TPA: hypothetical protein VFR25_03450 [Candidatus Eisenbacteria bacterium]|nr:hypothetical protein [Candidatus Eisenbacteria bacterium]
MNTARLASSPRVAALLAVLVILAGCNKSGTKTEASTDMAGSASSTAAAMGQSLMDQLGGMEGVVKLADAFGANLAANPALSSLLNADAITGAKQGLVNEIAKASNTPAPYAGASLAGSLSGKGLTHDSVKAVTDALESAADSMHLTPATKSSLMGLMAPISKALGG